MSQKVDDEQSQAVVATNLYQRWLVTRNRQAKTEAHQTACQSLLSCWMVFLITQCDACRWGRFWIAPGNFLYRLFEVPRDGCRQFYSQCCIVDALLPRLLRLHFSLLLLNNQFGVRRCAATSNTTNMLWRADSVTKCVALVTRLFLGVGAHSTDTILFTLHSWARSMWNSTIFALSRLVA